MFNRNNNRIAGAPNSRLNRWALAAAGAILLLAGYAGTAAAFINVADFGAKGDGSDATAAIQAAINSAGGSGDTIYLPAGNYGISASLTITKVMGLRILGDGVFATDLQPTSGMAGKPVVLFTDAMHCTIENLSVFGLSGAPPSAGIESDSAAGGEATHLTIKDVEIGSLSTASIVDGIKYYNPANADWNNDLGFIENVDINNFTHAGYSISGVNPLGLTIQGGTVGYGPIGVYMQGGSIKMSGTHFDDLTDVAFDFENVSNGTWGFYQHSIEIVNVSAEGDQATLLRTGTDGVNVSLTNVDYKFSPANAPIIDFQSTGSLFITASTFFMLGNSPTFQLVGGPKSIITLTDNSIALNSLTLDGHILSQGNCWGGAPHLTATRNSTIAEGIEACGGKFVRKMVSSN